MTSRNAVVLIRSFHLPHSKPCTHLDARATGDRYLEIIHGGLGLSVIIQ